jgi:membrane fusion protein, heavy metal efflux system
VNAKWRGLVTIGTVCLPWTLLFAGCGQGKPNPSAEAPPPAVVEAEMNPNNFTVDNPGQFKLATAVQHESVSTLNVTGVVQPDVARAVPVISLAAGRVVEIKARLGDEVTKGQVLLRVRSNDVSTAYQTYLKAVNDERLARLQDNRERILYEHGAVP